MTCCRLLIWLVLRMPRGMIADMVGPSTYFMIYTAFLLVTGAALSKAIGTVLSSVVPLILIVGGFGLLLLVLTVFAIGGLLGGSED